MSEVRRRETFYVLEMERDDKTKCTPVATYNRYVNALADGLTFHNKDGQHMRITRHSLPFYEKVS